ncbi:tyrosine-type recombinase/integrase [Pararhizobium sp. BT-229]|uniref:DUF6538 domain-containing protein n=1 Tax=Pararhizobium sp. BT-229 TaxID=2986923 RepID=UPI0021F7899E|nr:DUF6538 domain-containing protein [Pararhizobium sp. BT-229]MCV9965477.1 tyrosine-type recombinase/integrase [Pararhizobium sp. BT-229]
MIATGMAKKTDPSDADRWLTLRNGYYTYKRRVPTKLAELDSRGVIRIALGTRDVAEARAKRDIYERADDELWASLVVGGDRLKAEARYKSAAARASALGFSYRHISSILGEESGQSILDRLRALHDTKPGSLEATTIVGGIARPTVTVTEAFKVYCEEIVADELLGKSENQRASWRKVKLRAVTNFVDLCSDKILEEITRDDALKFYRFWQERVSGKRTHSASSGNRDIGNMRVLFSDYFKHVGAEGFKNPFDGLVFSEKVKKSRPPFPTEWIRDRIMAVGVLSGMNAEARGVVLAMIETGCRPSEICNLRSDTIILQDEIPHILIRPIVGEGRREIKTASSVRAIPLVGVALETFKKHSDGFPRYRDKETHMSNTLNKFFRENKLFPTSDHKIYSFRHSFEDRMKIAGFDTELRKILMGHSDDRPKYGAGGTLEWKRNELLRIALPFDSSIVT